MKKTNTVILTAVLLFATLISGIAQKTAVTRSSYQIQGNGIPAKSDQISYKQPDGSTISIVLKGDAAIHWAISDDGYTLLSNANGYYEYAKLDKNSNLVSSGIIASNSSSRKSGEISFLKSISRGLNYSESQINQKLNNYKSTKKGAGNAKSIGTTGTQNFIVLMIQFPDLQFTNAQSAVNNLMNQPNYNGTGSFKDFYFTNSNGKLTVNTTVSGIYTASHPHDYYGQNDGNGSDMNVTELVSEAIQAADASVDFSQFDNNNDGVADAVYIIYAGSGEASSGNPNDIWPHNNPSISPITVDGVTINAYTCSNELVGTTLVGIGTICHEFGHALGLPDFYDTDYAGSGGQAEGNGSWDVMAGGNSNGNEASPANHNPMSKQMMGWQIPQYITTNGAYFLPPSTQDTIAFLIDSPVAPEGFFFENRQFNGFDIGLQGHGMLIYHCDYAYFDQTHLANNNINANPAHQGFDIEEADGENTNEIGDTYPGTTSNTSFTDLTTPNSILWTSLNFGFPIVDIVENSTTKNIEFNISGFTGINELNMNNIQVYPTISSNVINIKSEEMIQEVILINLQGQLILTKEVSSMQTSINVSNLANGTYFIKTKTANHTSSCKIVVSK
jgi:M6 family metalloprotease-like protein